MRCPRCQKLWPVTYQDPRVWDCPTCVAAATQYTRDAAEREEAAPPATPDAKGQALLPGTEGIAPPIARPPAPRARRSVTLGPSLFD